MRSAQRKATDTYRARLADRGLLRFELRARDADRELLRRVATKLAEDGSEAEELRARIRQSIGRKPSGKKGGLLAALRASPLVGANLDFTRERDEGRDVEF